MEMIAVLRWMYPELDASIMRGKSIIYADAIAVWDSNLGAQPTPQEIAASELQAAKEIGISANRAECSRRIFERYPAGRQLSASFGLYDSANVATMVDWIAANVAAENTAADLIEAATTVAAVEAVTVAWPV